MIDGLLLDTDVIIDYPRGQAAAVSYLEALTGPLFISAITLAELYAGARPDEEAHLKSFIAAFDVVPVDIDIARVGGSYRRVYGKSHGTGIADALIAAAAGSVHAQLVTLNRKHFAMCPDLIVPYEKS
ncbi:MAG TPA: type II toxin-antitoxin system VapC family toxin [Blastocatellia bacterium]|nr:type II toxin-antitoxin system VapC family toxin [Blastocatellia bacterium]